MLVFVIVAVDDMACRRFFVCCSRIELAACKTLASSRESTHAYDGPLALQEVSLVATETVATRLLGVYDQILPWIRVLHRFFAEAVRIEAAAS